MPRDVISDNQPQPKAEEFLNRYEVANKGSKVAVLGLGNFFKLGQETVKLLAKEGISATLINPRFYNKLDEETLVSLKENHQLVVTLEDCVLDGGWGEKIARFYGNSNVKVLCYGAKKEFVDRVPVEELYKRYRLKPEMIVEDILKIIK